MARRENYLDHLANVPLFSAVSKRELQKIAKAGDETTVKAGTTLMSQGEAGRECFIIISGSASVKRGTRKVATLTAGEAAGELSLLDHGPRTATVVAEEDMTVYVLGARQFAGVLDEVPSLARKLMSALATRVRELDTKIYG